MKTIKSLLAIVSLTLCFNVFATTRYVSDDIYIYMHSGPSLDYRITGTIKVGAPVTIVDYNKKNKFTKVKTAKGKTGWVNNKELQKELPAKTRLPVVQKQLKQAQSKLNNIALENGKELEDKVKSIESKDSLITQLESEKTSLLATIDELKAKNLELDLLQDTREERIKMDWMLYGGSVLFFGVLFGLMIPFIPRRKKRRDNW